MVRGMTTEEWLVIAAWLAAVTGVGSFALTVYKHRETKEVIKNFEKGMMSFGKVIASYEKTLSSFERELKQRGAGKPVDKELERRRMELKERQQAWKETEGFGKAIWSVYKEFKKEED